MIKCTLWEDQCGNGLKTCKNESWMEDLGESFINKGEEGWWPILGQSQWRLKEEIFCVQIKTCNLTEREEEGEVWMIPLFLVGIRLPEG